MDRNCDLEPIRNAEAVALRKESVDRNFYYSDKDADWVRSLSARRAWIEMLESKQIDPSVMRRSPQGERG